MLPICPKDDDFIFETNLEESIRNEHLYETQDLGPTDDLPPDELEAACRWFFGTSPLSSAASSAASSPAASRSTSSIPPDVPSHSQAATPDPIEPVRRANNSRARRNKELSKSKRKNDRRKKQENLRGSSYRIKPGPSRKFTESPKATKMTYDASEFKMNAPGYTAPADDGGRVYDHEVLVKSMGFGYIPWDGKTLGPITDASGRIIGVFGAEPDDPAWKHVHRGAANAIEALRPMCRFGPKAKRHRRGQFPALNWGISYGGGQKKPGNLYHDSPNAEVLAKLTADPNISRIAGFANGIFATWAPNLHTYYEEHFDKLLEDDESLRRNFDNSVWASFAINFGPKTICRPHRDYANLPFSLCAITALGDYDPTRGGHLVLWDLKLVIEFPPGSTILIPSATISHANTPIGRGEKRFSFTQFSAGGLFRWVDQGCQPTPDYLASLTAEGLEEHLEAQEKRCKLGLSLFSTLDTLRADQEAREARKLPPSNALVLPVD